MAINNQKIKVLNIALWAAQVILSLTFFWSSYMKLFVPAEELVKMWPWAKNNDTLVKLTGILDLLVGVGIIFPLLLRIQPKLTIYAGLGTIALMIAASIFHIARGEASLIGVNAFFAALAIFIVWGKAKKSIIHTN